MVSQYIYLVQLRPSAREFGNQQGTDTCKQNAADVSVQMCSVEMCM